jgi:hypothetical protein
MAKDKTLKDKPTAHGKRPSEMRARHAQQLNGEELETIAANGKEAGDYRVDKDEAHLVHVEIEAVNYTSLGVKTSTPSVQKFTPKAYEAAKENNGFAGYATKILHAPKEAVKEQKVAIEGTRVVDSNYAAMQDRYEKITGERPDETLTPTQLDNAIIQAEKFAQRFAANQNAPAPIDYAAAPSNTPPTILGVSEPEADGKGDAKEAAAKVAKEAGENTPPSLDGNTSVGQTVVAPVDAPVAPVAPDAPVDAPAPSGRRGAAPTAAKK